MIGGVFAKGGASLAFLADKAWRGVLVLLLAGSMTLQGCTIPAAGVDADDFCSRNRQPLLDEIQRFNDTIAIGALGGALAGAAAGAAATGDIAGVLVGAAIGATAGGIGGYLVAKRRQAQQAGSVVQAINQDVRATRGWVTKVSEGVRRLNTCRANEVNDLRRRIQSGQISGEAARAELALLRERIAADRRLVNQVIGAVDENQGTFTAALAETQGVERDLVVSSSVRSYQPRVVGGSSGGGGGGIVRGMSSPGGETRYATAGVNVRAGPGTNFSRIGTFGEGQRVGFLGDAGGGWSRVAAGSGEGFVASRFLSASRPSAGGGTAAASGGEFTVPKAETPRGVRANSELEGLYIEAANLEAEDEAFAAEVDQELAALEALSR